MELLEHLEAKISRRTRRGLGFFFLGSLFLRRRFGGGLRRLLWLALFFPQLRLFYRLGRLGRLGCFFLSAGSFDIDLTLLSHDSVPTRHAALTRRVMLGPRPDSTPCDVFHDEQISVIKDAST